MYLYQNGTTCDLDNNCCILLIEGGLNFMRVVIFKLVFLNRIYWNYKCTR